MATRLKRLEVHGFKSFATATTFVFDAGITAIIGPNGSGKSNIADALRWVLGEQSMTSLRGRRTEDVIFAGSASRPPLGMAEVSLTLDNESGELPLDFSEVTVTRRAFRSGENQYLINGARVRLKDVQQLMASLGQAHTVIGQGLVDSVLAQRPAERRGLFEHAAGITGLRLKRAEAERHLAETETNSTRLEDLLAEIEPRLRSLERVARQAREFDQVRRELRAALEHFYAHQWRAVAARLAAAGEAVARAQETLAAAEQARETARLAVVEAARQTATLREQQEALDREIQELRGERDRLQHQIALAAERRSAREQRRLDLSQARDAIQDSLAAVADELAEGETALAALDRELAECEQQVADLEEQAGAIRARRGALEAELAAGERRLTEAERERLTAESKLALFDQQEQDLLASRERLEREVAERGQRIEELGQEVAAATRERDQADQTLAAMLASQADLATQLTANGAEREQAQAALERLERRLVEQSTRLEALERLRESGAGLFAGVRAVLEGAKAGQLTGIVGTLSSLLVVPAELEAAIEAALGGHLQDIVVEGWTDAEAAIAELKRTKVGRATFQPLDTVRARGQPRAPRHNVPGIRGVAAELIDYDPRVEPVVVGLLGRVMVAQDLDATHALLPSLSPGWSVVTLGGEIARSSGTVTGGARVKESGALARERELRELPRQCRRTRQELDQAREALEAVVEHGRRLADQRRVLEQEIAEAREALRAAEGRREQSERWLVEVNQADEAARQRQGEIDGRLEKIATDREGTRAAIDVLSATVAEAAAERDRLREVLRTVREDGEDTTRLQEGRAALSTLRERRRNLLHERDRLVSRRATLEREHSEADQRLTTLAAEVAQAGAAESRLQDEHDRVAALLGATEGRAQPARAELEQAAGAEQRARQELERLESRQREVERERDRLGLEHARREDEVNILRERVAHDLETEDVEAALAQVAVEEVPDLAGLERKIGRLRERLRRIGLVGEDAVEQYEREAERHAFLRQQLDDVHAAAETLRTLLTELDQTMTAEFDRTVGEVARAFEASFTGLFGGGRAQLVRTDEGDGPVGIDIVAQPPGKRLQNLALLSGGERALTAVALLFAILKVNPSPFCLLDEVDAALDEANVVRFRDELRQLAVETQFVVVTHNRATIEGADALYGITMGDDGLSRVLSLRLPAEAPV